MDFKIEFILCNCGSNEHQVIIHHDFEDKIVYLHIHLTKRRFFKRLVAGVRYIFGYRCRYGHWDEIILSKDNAEQFQNIANTLRNDSEL